MAAPSFELSPNGSNAADAPPDSNSTGQDLQFITSLDMEVKEGGKNFSTGTSHCSLCFFWYACSKC
jgi:hypothetical protein